MGQHPLDERTAERLISGALDPEDAPPGFAGVAALLQVVRTPPAPQEFARCSETVAAMASTVSAASPLPSVQPRARAGLSRLLRPRIAATLMVGALALAFGGLAEAGVLPGPLQHAAHEVLGALGISVPDSAQDGVVVATGPPDSLLPPRSLTIDEPVRGATGHGRSAAPRSKSGSSHVRSNHSLRTGRRGGSSTTTQTAAGPAGLCTAWSRGRGGDRGGKLSATAFRRLRAMATSHGETIAAFCSAVSTSPSGAGGENRPPTADRHAQGRSVLSPPGSSKARSAGAR